MAYAQVSSPRSFPFNVFSTQGKDTLRDEWKNITFRNKIAFVSVMQANQGRNLVNLVNTFVPDIHLERVTFSQSAAMNLDYVLHYLQGDILVIDVQGDEAFVYSSAEIPPHGFSQSDLHVTLAISPRNLFNTSRKFLRFQMRDLENLNIVLNPLDAMVVLCPESNDTRRYTSEQENILTYLRNGKVSGETARQINETLKDIRLDNRLGELYAGYSEILSLTRMHLSPVDAPTAKNIPSSDLSEEIITLRREKEAAEASSKALHEKNAALEKELDALRNRLENLRQQYSDYVPVSFDNEEDA